MHAFQDEPTIAPTTVTDMTPAAPRVQLSREQILAATARSLAEFGYDRTTIRRIASILDCAVGSIYRYFTDKRELLSAVTQQAMDPVLVLIDAGASLEQTARAYHQKAAGDPTSYRLMFWLEAVQQQNTPADHADEPAVPGVVRKIIAGWSRMLDDAALAQRCWATMHGLLSLGMDEETVVGQLRQLSSHAAVQRDLEVRRHVTRPQDDDAHVHANAQRDDVTLL